jgi:hypothetical protein
MVLIIVFPRSESFLAIQWLLTSSQNVLYVGFINIKENFNFHYYIILVVISLERGF